MSPLSRSAGSPRELVHVCSTLCLLASAGSVASAATTGGGQRLDAKSPMYEVDVDWAEFLSESDMLFDWKRNDSSATGWGNAVRNSTLPTNWLEGPALGNGLLGSVMYFRDPPPVAEGKTPGQASWGHGRGGYCEPGNATANAELRLELGRQDLYSARQPVTNFWNSVRLPVGYLRMKTAGKLLSGEMRLSLWDAEVKGNLTTQSGSVSYRHFVHATEPVHVLQLHPSAAESLSFEFVPLSKCVDRWDVANLINCTLHPSPQQVCTGSLEDTSAVSCLQRMGYNGTLLADQGSFATHVRVLRSTNGGPTTVLMTTQSAMWPHPVQSDPEAAASAVLSKYAGDLAGMSAAHTEWWHGWWPASFLSIPDAPSLSFYWLQMFQIGVGMREDGPVRDEIGPWYVDTEWPTLWLDLNLELTYWPIGPSNRLSNGYSLAKNLRTNIQNGHLTDNARRDPRLANVTDAMSLGASSNQMHLGGDSGDLMWVTNDVWQLCEYEYTATCFVDYLLPPLRGALGWYRHMLNYSLNGTATPGMLHLFPTDSPAGYPGTDCSKVECQFGEGWDAAYDISLARWGLEKLIEICTAIQQRHAPLFDKEDFALPAECDLFASNEAQRLLRDLAPIPVDASGINVWDHVPFEIPFRHFSHLLGFVPLQLYAMDGTAEEQEVCIHTLDTFYGVTWNVTGAGFAASTFSWPAVAQMSAYVGRADAAFGNITGMISHWYGAITPTAMDNEGSSAVGADSDVVNIDPCAVAAAADGFHKLLLQSYHGVLKIFPAVPSSWADASFHRLRGQRGFEVTAVRKDFATQWVAVRSMAGAPNLRIALDFATADGGSLTDVHVQTDAVGISFGVTAACSPKADDALSSWCTYSLNATLPANATVLLYPARNDGQKFVLERVASKGPKNAWGWHDDWGIPSSETPRPPSLPPPPPSHRGRWHSE